MNTHRVEPGQLLAPYFPESSWRLLDMRGSGVNNTTSFIETREGRFVLRVYETHRDEEKVRFEHDVLLRLAELELPIRMPAPVRTSDGNTYVRTPDGKLAALFRYIDGKPPDLGDLGQLRQFGEATAHLSRALASIRTERQAAYPPYYEIEHAHPRCSLSQLLELCVHPPAPFDDEGLARMLAELAPSITGLKRELPRLGNLKHQLIHGDLNASNALADEAGRISAILDFEFVTYDLRVMEAAVFLSDMVRSGEAAGSSLNRAEAFLTGYCSLLELTGEEIEALPSLMLLRRLDVLIHFLGRYWDGIDGPEQTMRQIAGMHAMSRWLERNEAALREVLERGTVR